MKTEDGTTERKGMEGCTLADAGESPHRHLVEGGHSCSVKGAILCAFGVGKTLPLLHASPGCTIMPYIGSFAGPGEIRTTANTALCSESIIYGGEQQLRNALVACYRIYRPEMIVVSPGCQAATIGDNVDAVIEDVGSGGDVAIPVVNARTSGYDGNIVTGFVKTGLRILEELCRPQAVEKNVVNILGFPAHFNVYWKGDVLELERLFAMLGLTIHCVYPGRCSVEQIREMPKACLNIVVDEQFGLDQAEFLRERFGTPYVSAGYGSVIGADNTDELLFEVVKQLGLDPGRCGALLEKNKAEAMLMASHGCFFWHEQLQNSLKTFGLTAPGGLALGLARLLICELGLIPAYINLNPSYVGAKDKMLKILELDGRGFRPEIFENKDDAEISEYAKNRFPHIIIGRGATHLKSEALLGGAFAYLIITYPAGGKIVVYDRPLMGYKGVAVILEDILNAMTYFI